MAEAMPISENGQIGTAYDIEKAEIAHHNPKKTSGGCKSWLRSNLLLIFTLFGIVVGMALGFGLHPLKLSEEVILAIGFPGDIFMRCLKLLILPLIVTSLITGGLFHSI